MGTPRLLLLTQTPDAKKEEYRKYLEKSGVVDSLTKGERPLSLHGVSIALPRDISSTLPPPLCSACWAV